MSIYGLLFKLAVLFYSDMQSRFTMSKDTQFHYQHGPNYVDDDDDFLDYNSEKKSVKALILILA